MSEQRDLVRPEVLAAEWDLDPRTLGNWRHRGVGPPFVKLNGAVRYSRKAAARWLQERTVEPKGAA